jgi:hypothetical protein
MIEIVFFIAITVIVGVGIYLMRETDKFVEEQNIQIILQQSYDSITKMSKQKKWPKQMEFKFDK